MDRQAGALALERPPLLARARQEPEAASGHARSRLGRPRARPGLRGARGQAHLRLDRRRHRLPLRGDRVGAQPRHARRLAGLVAEPGRASLLLHGEGQHRLPQRHLAGAAPRLRRGGRVRRRARSPRAAVRHRQLRVPDDGGPPVQHEPGRGDLRRRLPQPLRPGSSALLPHRRRAGDPGHRLHVGRVRSSQQRRACCQLGQPRQSHPHERVQELRRRSGAGSADRRRHRGDRGGRGGLRLRRRADRAGSLQGGARRNDAARVARQRLRQRGSAVGDDQGRSRAGRDRALRHPSLHRQPEDALHAVPAVHVPGAARAARVRRRDRG